MKPILSVFLSHSHKDIDKVRKIRDILEAINVDPIMFYLKCLDDNNVILEDFIKKEIEARNIFIYCRSSNAERSAWVQKELDYIRKIDYSRLYVIDIENKFEKSLVTTLQALIQLICRNNVILCHSQHQDEIAAAKTIAIALETKGYNIETVSLRTSAPSMKILNVWEYQNIKQEIDSFLENKMEPVIKKVANKGIIVPLLSPNLFQCDEQWAHVWYHKMSSLFERYNCLAVPLRIDYPITNDALHYFIETIYKKSVEKNVKY